MHPDAIHVATGEVGLNPAIIVWSTATMTRTSEFRQGMKSRGVGVLKFNRDGKLLLSIALDSEHMVRVWDWKSGSMRFQQTGSHTRILSACFSQLDNSFVTVGMNHIAFWEDALTWEKKQAIFG
jgi:microtubule-associated protein-like 6